MDRALCRGCSCSAAGTCRRCTGRLLTQQSLEENNKAKVEFRVIKGVPGDFKAYTGPTKPFNRSTSYKPARGKRKKKNFVGLRRKGYHKEKKHAPVKLVSTEVGTGIAARRDFQERELITFYGGVEIHTKENLDTVTGQKRAGIKNTSYLLATEKGWINGGTEMEKKCGRLGSFANASTGRTTPSKKRPMEPNAFYDEDETTGLPVLRALTKINKGDEIVTCYGWTPRTWKRNLMREHQQAKKTKTENLSKVNKCLNFEELDDHE
jgi:hypothetical protein